MRVSLDDSPIKKLQTKRLLRYGTTVPQELYHAIEELKDEMLFQPLSSETFARWFESLRSKLNKAVEVQIIKDFRIEWHKGINSDVIELKVDIQEYSAAQIQQINVTFTL